MSYDERYQYGAGTEYLVTSRCSNPDFRGSFRFTEKFLRLPKKDEFDALMILGCRMNHNQTEGETDEYPGQDEVNSFAWNGFSKKGRSIKIMNLLSIHIGTSEPSSLEDKYTEIQSTVSVVDYGVDDTPDLASEGVLAMLWVRNIFSAQDGYAADCAPCGNVQNIIHFMQLAPFEYDYGFGLPITPPLIFHHRTFEYRAEIEEKEWAKEAYVLMKIMAKVRFLASEKSIIHGE